MSDMGPDKGGITYSFSFRSVQEKQNVNEDGTLAQPRISKKMRKTYMEGQHIFKTDHYKTSKAALQQRMLEFLGNKQSSS